MGIVWVLATGRNRDMGPPLGWWRGPAWLGWVLLLAALGWWSVNGFLVWTSAAMGNDLVGGGVVLLQISAVLLVRYPPPTAVRVSFVATVAAALVARPIPRAIGAVHSWPLDAYLLPPAAYRIVQESLSNALRHSPGAPVDVRLLATARDIELSVDNGPSGRVMVPGEGSGLAGIRERVSVIGGECTAGRRADGGFRVWARLPR